MRYLLILIFAASAFGQVQELPVMGFSGGLVNSVANSLMKDNQLTVMENYDLSQFGYLVRRPGLELHYTDDNSGEPIQGIYSYYAGDEKQMLLVRSQSGYYALDTVSGNVYLLTLCDDTLGVCTTTVFDGFHSLRRSLGSPANTSSSTINNNLLIASGKSELTVWDGEKAFPARPRGPGQPLAVAMDGGGEITGKFQYCYNWVDVSDATADSATIRSSMSKIVHVTSGKVFLSFDTTTDALIDSTQIWRTIVDEADSNYYLIGVVGKADSIFIDTLGVALDTLSSTSFGWHCVDDSTGTFCSRLGLERIHRPPGGLDVSFMAYAHPGVNNYPCGVPFHSCNRIEYHVVFVDSAGRWSDQSPNICAQVQNFQTGIKAFLTNIPVPRGNHNISYKLVFRGEAVVLPDCYPDTAALWINQDNMFRICSLAIATTTFTDTAMMSKVGVSIRDTIGVADSLYIADDSVLSFKPLDIAVHGTRLYAIGDLNNRNWVYYSDFGRPTTFGPDWLINIPSSSGDWFVRLLSLSNNRLLLFRQNSIVVVEGLSFFQYVIDESIRGVGLSAPRSLAYSHNKVYFAHATGIYDFSRFGSPDDKPVSVVISNVVDSVGDKLPRSFGAFYKNEYWWSVPIDSELNERTYIYTSFPTPYWKTYDFGILDAVLYDYDTTVQDYRSDKMIILRDNDSLYRWGYSDTSTTDAGVTFVATAKTKSFLEGPGRKKIHWVDILGDGTAPDTLTLTFYDKLGLDSVSTTTIIADFSGETRNRVRVNNIFENFTIRISDGGTGDYRLHGFLIGWNPTDGGKLQ